MKSKDPKLPFLYPALFLFFLTSSLKAQQPLAQYINDGLNHNIIVQQKKTSLQQARQSLEIARSYFLPSVHALADYTSGQGGRSISIPIGDLLNPVYSSLNQLTESNAFQQVENVSQDFFPYNFYDAKIRTTVPIINAELYISKSIMQQNIMLTEYEVNAYKRQLVLDIKTAYYNYLTALEAVKIHESALILVNKNVQVNESLLKNGKSLPANFIRSTSEAERVKAELNKARNQVENAKMYFNFLLNRELNANIEVASELAYETTTDENPTIEQREELYMLKTAKEIKHSSVQLYNFARLPKVNAFFDLGTQASDWQMNDDSRYYLFGVQLSVPIFQGFRNNVQIRQAKLDVEKADLDVKHMELQLQMAADVAQNNLQTSQQNYLAARAQLTAAKGYFNLIDKGYQQGINSLIEFIDARNQLTASELQLNLIQFQLLISAAQVEREISSYNLNK